MKSVIIFSGGQDSTTCLLRSLKEDSETVALTFDYGQKNRIEIECAKKICEKLGVKQEILDVSGIFHFITNTPYLEKESTLGGKSQFDKNLPSTWVPHRNALFITMAHSYALKIGYDKVVTGVNSIDYSGYPDCRPEFIKAIGAMLSLSAPVSKVKIEAPLINLTKAEIWKMAYDLGGIDFIKSMTHTCYNGDHQTENEWGFGCGECDSCKIRKNSFEEFLSTL